MSARTVSVGLTQWHPTLDVAANTAMAIAAIEVSTDDGADLVLLPENGLCLGTNADMRERALTLRDPAITALRDAARRTASVVVVGGIKRLDDDGVVHNSALVLDGDGELAGIYDKIHLFDAHVGSQSFDASSVETAGDRPLIARLVDVSVGVTICFDVRFPELFRTLSAAGAEVLLVPAAFTRTTGAAHWETLLRARAIENAAFVVASATISADGDPMPTWGHALAVDPWGQVLADLGEAEFATRVVALELDRRAEMLARLPVLDATRPQASAAAPEIVNVMIATEGATDEQFR